MQNAPDTRASLLLRLREPGDEQAWQDFVEIYGPLISRLATQMGLQPADANDISQDVLTRVAKAVQSWDHNPARGTFRGWLTRVTKNLAIEQFRAQKRRPTSTNNSQELAAVEAKPIDDQTFDWEQRRQLFLWAAEKAKPHFAANTWEAFWMTSVEQITPDKAAKKLRISIGAVYIARSRVMARIKSCVDQSQFDSNCWSANDES